MRAIEFLTEYRNGMYQYIKSIVPTWPDYIVKDWLYPGFSRYNDKTKRELLLMLNREGLNRNTQWQLVPNMKFTMDIWTSHTLKKLQGRAGGLSDMGMDIPRDAERHATQAQLAQQQGGVRSEPVILIKRPDGYELLEGWHRTIQHFHKFPDGYTGPAYVAVAQSKQGVAEGFFDRFKKKLTANRGGIDLTASKEDGRVIINASSQGKRLGIVMFNINGKTLVADRLMVQPEYRGQGIAEIMYDWAKELGYTVQRSSDQTADGKRFWNKLKGEETNVWEQGIAEGLEHADKLSGLVDLPVFPSSTNPRGTAKVVNTGDRIMAVLNVRGVNIPYYISTGGGGKASVPTGKWYPIFGRHSSGWLNKGGEDSINKSYGSNVLALGSSRLNNMLGDLSSMESQIPFMKKSGDAIINRDLQPMSYSEVSANPDEFKKRVNSFLAKLGSPPFYKVNATETQAVAEDN